MPPIRIGPPGSWTGEGPLMPCSGPERAIPPRSPACARPAPAAAARNGHRHPVDVVVVLPRTHAKAEVDPAVRQPVDHGHLLGHRRLVARRENHDAGRQAHALGHGGGAGVHGMHVPGVVVGPVVRAQRVKPGLVGRARPGDERRPGQPVRHHVRESEPSFMLDPPMARPAGRERCRQAPTAARAWSVGPNPPSAPGRRRPCRKAGPSPAEPALGPPSGPGSRGQPGNG